MRDLLTDIRFAARMLAKSPGFTAVAVLTLALGIGANTAIFSFVDRLLVRVLPVHNPEELVVFGPGALGVMGRSTIPQTDHFSYSQYKAISAENDIFTHVAATPTFSARVPVGRKDESPSERRRARCELVSGEYFRLLGVRPQVGRLLEAADDVAPGAHNVVVLSHDYWQRMFGGSLNVLGESLFLGDHAFTIIGVADRAFSGHTLEERTDLWVPLVMQAQITRRDLLVESSGPYHTYWLNILGRLKPGISRDQAEGSLNVRMQQIFLAEAGEGISEDRRAEIEDVYIRLTPLARGLSSLRGRFQTPLLFLWAATALVLLIACANLANLLLARATGRRREMSLRLALGAGRWRLVRQLMTESLLLSGMGAAAGIIIASWLIPVLRAMVAEMRGPASLEVTIDPRVLLFAAGAALLTALLFGLAPALLGTRTSLYHGLRGASLGPQVSRGDAGTKAALVVLQTAFSLVLLAGAGLFLRSLSELHGVDLGLNADTTFYLTVRPEAAALPKEGQPTMRDRILERVSSVPGVESAAFTGEPALSGNYRSTTVGVNGYDPAPDENTAAVVKTVTASYFTTLGIPLLEGREFAQSGREGAECIVNEAFSKRYFQGGSALGGVVVEGVDESACRIVGVAGNVREVNLRGEPPQILYRPASGPDYLETLIVRAIGSPEAVGNAVRSAVIEVEPTLPVDTSIGTFARLLDRATAVERIMSRLTTSFAVLALLLAAIGLYGVLSYLVQQRTNEIGLRQALGATQRDILKLFLGYSLCIVLAGAGLGLLGVFALGRTVSTMLYEVGPADPTALGLALVALVAAGGLAGYLPARRAARIDPMQALRYE